MALAPLLAITLALPGAIAQTFQSQVNISICNWYQFRASVIRDTIYVDGGALYWQRGFSDGTLGAPKDDGNPNGVVYSLHMGKSFDTSKTNLTGLFEPLSKTGGAANNIAPTTRDGVMFSNDNEFILYGGLVPLTDAYLTSPREDSILTYERYQYGPPRTSFSPGFVQGSTGDKVNRYITHGAGVSIPSENLGYYFSGNRGKDWGEIKQVQPLANFTANTLISVDMTEMRGDKWDNATLPDTIHGRANAELVWIPVSTSGVLIAIGGVVNPVDIYEYLDDDQVKVNNDTGSDFMKSLPVYDVSSQKWFSQNTTGDYPPPLSQFCSVVAQAKDKSSFNIYIYGGWDGTDDTKRPSDAVYVLSVPSFTWVKVYDGQSNHGRRGHKCFKAYPDKMLVLGGSYLSSSTCLRGGIIQVFNLNTLKFEDVYDPQKWDEYKVPDLITAKIGGNADGGAKIKDPETWATNDLRDIFRTEYTKTINTYYPYTAPASTVTPTPTPNPGNQGGGNSLPKWVPPVLGVVLGLVAVGVLAILWLVWRRRQQARNAPSVVPVSENRNRILGWMYGVVHPPNKLDMTTTSTEIGINDKLMSGVSEGGFDSVASPHPTSTIVYSEGTNAQEIASVAVHEMQADAPIELATEYNVTRSTPSSPQARHLSDAPSFPGTISPPVSPTPDQQRREVSHTRHHSSISSAGFPSTLADAVARDETEQRQLRHTSAFIEDLPSTEMGKSPKPPHPGA